MSHRGSRMETLNCFLQIMNSVLFHLTFWFWLQGFCFGPGPFPFSLPIFIILIVYFKFVNQYPSLDWMDEWMVVELVTISFTYDTFYVKTNCMFFVNITSTFFLKLQTVNRTDWWFQGLYEQFIMKSDFKLNFWLELQLMHVFCTLWLVHC